MALQGHYNELWKRHLLLDVHFGMTNYHLVQFDHSSSQNLHVYRHISFQLLLILTFYFPQEVFLFSRVMNLVILCLNLQWLNCFLYHPFKLYANCCIPRLVISLL